MSPERIIPITPVMRRYQRLGTAAQRDRLSEARRVLEHPEELAAEFATSVRHFAAYRNSMSTSTTPRPPRIRVLLHCR